jgi:DNA mismatch repair protein MutS
MQRRHAYEKASWFLDAGNLYSGAILALDGALTHSDLRSQALQRCRSYIDAYTDSEPFQSLLTETKRLKAAMAKVDYCVRIRGLRVTVTPYRGEHDYSAEVLETFSKFQQGDVESRRIKFAPEFNNHIQERIVELVARLYPDLFRDLVAFHHTYAHFLDPVIERFDREIQFYVAYLKLLEPLKRASLGFCYPGLSSKSKHVAASDTFDIALAIKRVDEQQPVVVNGFELKKGERIFVVSGPNQGGKTTFARTFGQLHYLARLGCPVPGAKVRLYLCDRIFSHFEKQERMEDLHGKLEEELLRVREILRLATDRSVVVMNESLASTTAQDAHFLGREVIGRLIDLGALAVYVTFIDELSRLGPSVVSMVSTVVPENPAERTFKVVRRSADGRAYAAAIAQKYGLTQRSIEERVRR